MNVYTTDPVIVKKKVPSNNKFEISSVTSMEDMFFMSDFDQPIGEWKFPKLKIMTQMFQYNTQFNKNISGWDVSGVTDMQYMFYGSGFNQDISDWNVSSVINMDRMFESSIFNQSIDAWEDHLLKDVSVHKLFGTDAVNISCWWESNAIQSCNNQ